MIKSIKKQKKFENNINKALGSNLKCSVCNRVSGILYKSKIDSSLNKIQLRKQNDKYICQDCLTG